MHVFPWLKMPFSSKLEWKMLRSYSFPFLGWMSNLRALYFQMSVKISALLWCGLFSKCLYNDSIQISSKAQRWVTFDGNHLILCITIKNFISIERLGIITPASYLLTILYEECPRLRNGLTGYYFKIYLFLGFYHLDAEFPEKHFSFFRTLFYWSIVDLQCCVSFRCTAKRFSYIYIYIYSFSDSFPL